jgi:hypothetical protein
MVKVVFEASGNHPFGSIATSNIPKAKLDYKREYPPKGRGYCRFNTGLPLLCYNKGRGAAEFRKGEWGSRRELSSRVRL